MDLFKKCFICREKKGRSLRKISMYMIPWKYTIDVKYRHICGYIYIYHIYIYVYICVYICVYIYICMYVYIYIYAYIYEDIYHFFTLYIIFTLKYKS